MLFICKGRSGKKSFNNLLRGSNIVRAKLRNVNEAIYERPEPSIEYFDEECATMNILHRNKTSINASEEDAYALRKEQSVFEENDREDNKIPSIEFSSSLEEDKRANMNENEPMVVALKFNNSRCYGMNNSSINNKEDSKQV